MKNLAILLFISTILFACNKSDPILPIEPENTFKILPSSSNYLKPYYERDSVIFVDSLGNELILKIKTTLNSKRTSIWTFYDVNVVGDTVQREYPCTGDRISLKDDSGQYLITMDLFPQLYIPSTDTNSMKAVDHLFIWLNQAFYPKTYSVYSKIIDARGSEEDYHYWSINITEPTRTFWGATFLMVEHTDYHNPKALVYFNTTEGIVAFTDYNHKLWRLKQ